MRKARSLVCGLVVGLLAGCGAELGDELPGEDELALEQQELFWGGSSDPNASAGCDRLQLSLGGLWTVNVDGQTRSFWVQIPSSYKRFNPEPTPLVLSYHGFQLPPLLNNLVTMFPEKAEEEGFIGVYPRGTGDPISWNGGGCCGDAVTNNVDDVGFTEALLDKIESKLCVDTSRVYASGFSNGGYLAYRLACEISDRIAAVGSVAGPLSFPACNPSRAVPVLHIHGTADPIVPYFTGLPDQDTVPVADNMAFWAAANQCASGPTQTFQNGDATCERYGDCTAGADVDLCTIDEGGHTWPGGLGGILIESQFGKVSNDLDANDRLWSFFEEHPLP